MIGREKWYLAQEIWMMEYRGEELNPIIYQQLQNIADNGPLKSSMDKVKLYLTKQYAQMAITNDYWSYIIWHELDDDVDFDLDYCKMVENMTAADVQRMAQRLLAAHRCIEVTMLSEWFPTYCYS